MSSLETGPLDDAAARIRSAAAGNGEKDPNGDSLLGIIGKSCPVGKILSLAGFLNPDAVGLLSAWWLSRRNVSVTPEMRHDGSQLIKATAF